MDVEPGSLRDNLKNSTEYAWRLYCALEKMLPYKEASYGKPMSRQKLTASPIPWHGAAADLVLNFYNEVRRLEVGLTAESTGILGNRRGGSNANTRFAVERIVQQSHAVDDALVRGVLSFFLRWIRRAEAVFNPDLGLHRIPREPGEEEMRCPWCDFQTLRWQPATGVMVCINPECRTTDDLRPRWRADYELTGDELKFTWTPLDEGTA